MIKYFSTETISLDELTPYPGNARKGDVPKIVESLKKNGQYRSLVVRRVDGKDTVLAGNHTMLALKEMGQTEARCEVVICDDDTARRVNLADNRTAELGDYDEGLLADLLRSLDDLDGTGYDLDDLDSLLAEEEVPESPAVAEKKEKDPEPEEDPEETSELILVLTVAERAEVIEIVKKLRAAAGNDITSGQVVLAALRAY